MRCLIFFGSMPALYALMCSQTSCASSVTPLALHFSQCAPLWSIIRLFSLVHLQPEECSLDSCRHQKAHLLPSALRPSPLSFSFLLIRRPPYVHVPRPMVLWYPRCPHRSAHRTGDQQTPRRRAGPFRFPARLVDLDQQWPDGGVELISCHWKRAVANGHRIVEGARQIFGWSDQAKRPRLGTAHENRAGLSTPE